jgi:hypothetical protein
MACNRDIFTFLLTLSSLSNALASIGLYNRINERLMAPRLPFMQIRKLSHQMGGCGIVGQVINASVDINNMVTTLPRQLDNDYSFNVHLKRNLIHKSTYMQECIKKATVKP